MCGIAGQIDFSKGSAEEELRSQVRLMIQKLRTRGPDGEGIWSESSNGICLGHTRLSIIDLSKTGDQPMQSSCGRYVLSFNGEIYNFQKIKLELSEQGVMFSGNSDTEVLLEGIANWGIKKMLQRALGMFAFAVWDRKTKILYLARDRVGEKPLYWHKSKNKFVFGSELKSICAHPKLETSIDRGSLATFFRHSYILAPKTIFREINQLEPGSYLVLNSDKEHVTEKYWSIDPVQISEQPRNLDNEELEKILHKSVSSQMFSDVPLGAFLSGGIDSSLIVALMKEVSPSNVKSFSIGFEEEEYNEAPYAKEVARHLGTDHTEMYVTAKMAQDLIPELHNVFDEPFADSSQLPTMLLSKLTRQSVKVALSGDGGDELFGGYSRYFHALNTPKKSIKNFSKESLVLFLSNFSPDTLDFVQQFVPRLNRIGDFGKKIHELASDLSSKKSFAEISFQNSMAHWHQPCELVIGSKENYTAILDRNLREKFFDELDWMRFLDFVQYLPCDILTKVDRSSMAYSLETRAPFLDKRVVEYAWQIPSQQLIRNGCGKLPLRAILSKYVPDKLIDRPKMGFGLPIDQWLRNDLRDWAEELLNPKKIEQDGILNTELIQQKWKEHISGSRNWHYHIWDVLIFQQWFNSLKN